MAPDELFKSMKPAVVKIVLKQMTIPLGHGTGFFISKDGELLTNLHVLASGLRGGAFGAVFELADGAVVTDYEIARCSDERGIDLCLVRLKIAPKKWVPLAPADPDVGAQAFVIGHPYGLDFSLSDGLVSGYRSHRGVRMLQMTAPISPGNSGGPVLSKHGELVGVATMFRTQGQNLNFAVSPAEVSRFVARGRADGYRPSRDYVKLLADAVRARAESRFRAELKPAMDVIAGDRDKLTLVSEPAERLFIHEGAYLYSYLPKSFECAPAKIMCTDGSDAVFNYTETAVKPGFQIAEGKTVGTPKPLPIVQELQKQGRWSEFEKKLTEKQRSFLFSSPKPITCGPARRAAGFIPKGQRVCSYLVLDDEQPGAATYSVIAVKGEVMRIASIWVRDTRAAPFYFEVPYAFMYGARPTTKEAVERRLKELERQRDRLRAEKKAP